MQRHVTESVVSFEAKCQEATREAISNAQSGEAHSKFLALLDHMYLFSCCHWGCHGKEHIFEYLGGRVVTHCIAAERLMMSGYYDEALSLIRSVGEIANLMNLFMADNSHIRKWLDADRRTRMRDYSPQQIRSALSAGNHLLPFDDDAYRDLCETVTHPTPDTKPNAHDNGLRPVLGAHFQLNGFATTSSKLYWALAATSGPIAKLAILPQEQAEQIIDLVVSLTEIIVEDE